MQKCVEEAAAFVPFETGGIFLGRHNDRSDRIVEHMIGPGPRAVHHQSWLEVDDAWQNAEIASVVKRAGSTDFLGEWHTHPASSTPNLSRQDRRTLAKLALFPDLRCPDPVMAIFFRHKGRWSAGAWRLTRRTSLPLIENRVEPIRITVLAETVCQTRG